MGPRSDSDGGFGSVTDYYVERAKGGAGLIMTGSVTVSDRYEEHPCLAHYHFRQNARLSNMTEEIHHHGSKLCLQLSPGIGRMNWVDPNTPPFSSSAIPNYYYPDMMCREMPVEGIQHLVKAMGRSAQLAKDAGVDMVEVLAYGGYLIDQFSSAYWNKRTDEYGGNFHNRTRFLREIIEEIYKTCGSDFPVSVKVTLDSVYPSEERPKEEGIAIVKMLHDMGVPMIHVGRGSYSCRYRMVSAVYMDHGFDMDAVKEVKDMFPDLSIMGHGKMNDIELAERAVEEKYMDYVAIAHGLLADPHWPNKVRDYKYDEIIPCIGCGECHFQALKGKVLGCAVNPVTGHEGKYELTPATTKQKVLVIGAGPGGMKAAITSAKRGYETALWEKNKWMGGRMKVAGSPYCKQDVMKHVEYLIRQVHAHDIDLRLGFEGTLEAVKAYDPDVVIVATGSSPVKIPVPGKDNANVYFAEEVLLRQKDVGQKVIVIGGGEVGCETALELAHRGKDVSIIEMQDDILKGAAHFVANDQNLRHLVDGAQIDLITSAKVQEIKEDSVVYEKDGVTQSIACDDVVFAAGFRSDHTLFNEIYDAGYEVVQVGDNIAPGKVIDAVHGGYHAIRVLP